MYLTVLAANQAVVTTLSTLVASAIGGLVAVLVARQSRKGQADVANTTSRSDIEKEAYKRAESYYTGVIANQDQRDLARLAEIERCEQDAADARAEAAAAREQATAARQEAHQANQASEDCQVRMRELEKQVRHYRLIGRRLAKVILDKQGNLDDPAVHEAVLTFVSDGDDLPKT